MEQHGFHDIQLIYTIINFATSLNNSGQVDAILLDLSKAFNKVPHARLCHKLSSFGSILKGSGLLLFLCYINDLHKWVKSSTRLYVDDALLYREIHSPTDQDILQQDLYMGIYLANDIQSREECVLEDHKQLSPFIYYSMNNIPIQQVDHAKYLGVLID